MITVGTRPRAVGRLLPPDPAAGRFALGATLNSIGIGTFYSFSLLYYRSVSGLGLTTIGIVLAVATLAGLPLMPWVGRVADRFGPKRMLVAAALIRAAVFGGYEATHGLAAFALITMAAALGTRVEQLAAPMLCASAASGEPGPWITLYRTAFNAGIGGGALLASLVVTVGNYHALGIGTGLCFLAAGLCYSTLPATPPVASAHAERPAPAWRDLPFLRVAVVNGVFWLAALVLEYGLPIYLIRSLELSTWTVGGFFGVNTVLVTTLQSPVGRWLQSRHQGWAVVTGGLLYVGASLVLATAMTVGAALRLAEVLAVAVVWSVGEVITGQCILVLLTRMAPAARRGGYLAFNQFFVGVATAFAPLLVTTALTVRAGFLWCALALTLVCAVALVPRTRNAAAEAAA